MRRAVPAAVITLIGLGALASFRSTPPVATKPAVAPSHRAAAAPNTSAPAATAPPPPGATTPAPRTPASTPPTTAPAPSTQARTFDGDPYDNRYGTVQVRITVQGGQITGIAALQMPYDRSRSQYISQQAEPLLRQEALQAQSARIDIVSGATYTSEGYAQSLQSALDKAGM